MQSDIAGEKFIVSAENISFKEVIWQMADELKVKRPTFEAGNFLREFVWRLEAVKYFFTKQRPLITKESAKLASIDFYYSNEKIKRTLNFNFKPVKETIAETAEVFLKSQQAKKKFGVFE